MPERIIFMGTALNVAGREEVLRAIEAATPANPVRIATPNPEFMLEAQRDPGFRAALEGMTHCVIDGSGLYFALRLLKRKNVEHYPGADLAADLLARYQGGEKRFWYFGNDNFSTALEAVRVRHAATLEIEGCDGGKVERDGTADPALAGPAERAGTDIGFVGFGAPRQERWMAAHAGSPVPALIGVGGTFDFYARKKRAPRALRTLHLEWLFRALTERGHWKRAFRALVVFPLKALVSR